METYKLLEPADFLPEHLAFIEKAKSSIQFLSEQSNDMLGIKDINSQHIISTDAYAKIVALKKGNEVEGRMDLDMPCQGTAEYAHQYVAEDKGLLSHLDIDKQISVLNIHHYGDGLKARVFKKKVLHYEPTKSILGTVYSGHDVELRDFISVIPNFIIQFGATGSIKVIDSADTSDLNLNEYEQEICFLFLLKWEPRQIAEFMNVFRPGKEAQTEDSIIKYKKFICHKLNIPCNAENLRDYLVSINFHNNIPKGFYNQIIGSTFIG